MLCRGVVIAGLILVTFPVHAVEDSWTSCRVDKDCIVVGSICPNFYWAINRTMVFENAARNASERGNVDCAVSFQTRPKHATCLQGQCHIPLNKALSAQSLTVQ